MMRWYKKTRRHLVQFLCNLFAGFKEQTHQAYCGMVQSAKYASCITSLHCAQYDLEKFEICDAQFDSPLSKDEVVMLLVEKPDEGALGSVSFLTNVAQGF